MTTTKRTQPVQGGLFNGASQSLDIDAAVRRALRAAFRLSEKSRQAIADEMSRLTGRKVTASILDHFTAESRSDRRFPAAWLPAFCVAAGTCDVMKLLVEAVGFRMIDADEAMLIEYARATLDKKEAAEKIENLESRLMRNRDQ
jgi:hypothetical protein